MMPPLRGGLPDPLLARVLLARAAVLWVLVRSAVPTIEFLVLRVVPAPFVPPHVAAVVVIVVGSLLLVDVRRRGEHVLLANLGTGGHSIVALGLGCALSLEMAMATLGAIARQGAR